MKQTSVAHLITGFNEFTKKLNKYLIIIKYNTFKSKLKGDAISYKTAFIFERLDIVWDTQVINYISLLMCIHIIINFFVCSVGIYYLMRFVHWAWHFQKRCYFSLVGKIFTTNFFLLSQNTKYFVNKGSNSRVNDCGCDRRCLQLRSFL